MFELAKERYTYRKAHPREAMGSIQQVPRGLQECNRLCILLMPAIPEELKLKVLEDAGGSIHAVVVNIQGEVWRCAAHEDRIGWTD